MHVQVAAGEIHSPSLWVKDPMSSQSQKNEGCFLKWFQLSWGGEVTFNFEGWFAQTIEHSWVPRTWTALCRLLTKTLVKCRSLRYCPADAACWCPVSDSSVSMPWPSHWRTNLSSTHWKDQQHTIEVSLYMHLPWSSLSLLYCVSPLWTEHIINTWLKGQFTSYDIYIFI